MTARSSDTAPAATHPVSPHPVSFLGRFSWVLFEVGRNPSYVLIATFIYAPYFANTIVGDPVRGQALWADIQIYAGLLVAFTAPFFGAIAEAGGPRKPWIAGFAALLVIACCSLWFGMPGGAGLSLFALGAVIAINNFAYDATIAFHGAMLSSLGRESRIGRLSGLGYGLGNVATFTLLVFFLATIALPPQPLFGLDRATHEDARSVGPLSALWFVLFAIPFFLFTPDRPRTGLTFADAVHKGLLSLAHTVRSLRHYSNVAKFLLARMIYNDGLNTMLGFGGLYAAGVFGWGITDTGLYGIVIIPFAALGGILGGRLADRIGARRTLQLSLSGTLITGLLSLGFTPERLFFFVPYPRGAVALPLPYFETLPELCYLAVVCVMAVCIVASYANSRTMLARLAPESHMTEFFGLFTMSGEATSWAAPAAVAIATRVSDSQQWGMAVILLFLAAGLALLTLVREERATAV